ncbi:LEG4 protein, partial [Nothoprocta ornata]|nr:LEG4 protein [Nothoprocta ornata]
PPRVPPLRFHINLRAGAGGDVLLHLNPRPGEGSVVRNSRLGGHWGSEERELPHNPLQRGRYFDVSAGGPGGGRAGAGPRPPPAPPPQLSIRCGNHRFKVFAEGQPLF